MVWNRSLAAPIAAQFSFLTCILLHLGGLVDAQKAPASLISPRSAENPTPSYFPSQFVLPASIISNWTLNIEVSIPPVPDRLTLGQTSAAGGSVVNGSNSWVVSDVLPGGMLVANVAPYNAETFSLTFFPVNVSGTLENLFLCWGFGLNASPYGYPIVCESYSETFNINPPSVIIEEGNQALLPRSTTPSARDAHLLRRSVTLPTTPITLTTSKNVVSVSAGTSFLWGSIPTTASATPTTSFNNLTGTPSRTTVIHGPSNPPSTTNHTSGLSSGAKIGIGLAIPLVVIFGLVLRLLWVFQRRKASRSGMVPVEKDNKDYVMPYELAGPQKYQRWEAGGGAIYEADSLNVSERVYELDGAEVAATRNIKRPFFSFSKK